MKVTVRLIVTDAFGRIPPKLVKGQEDVEIRRHMETIQITASRSARILGRVLETWEHLLSLKLQWKIISYIHNPARVLENDTHKLLWDFDIQMDHLISARRPDLIIIKKKKKKKKRKKICKIVDFAVPADHRIKLKEYEKRGKYLDLARELKKLCFWHGN